MSAHVTTTMDTPFGEVEVVITSGDHIAVFANGPLNVPERRRTVMVNRVEYVVIAHFAKLTSPIILGEGGPREETLEAGTWVTGAENSYPGVRGTHFSCHKAKGGSNDYSWNAWDKLKTGLTDALNAWVRTDEGKAALARAVAAYRDDEIKLARLKIENLKAQLAEAEGDLDRLLADAPSIFGAAR